MIVVPYKPEHLQSLLLQPSQAFMRPFLDKPEYQQSLAIPGKTFTAMDGERVLACAGIVPFWEGRAEAWALMGPDLRRDFIHIHYAAKRFFNVCGFRRIEAAVDAEFGCAKAWMKALGFIYEGPLLKYTPDGRDCLRYARIQ